MKMVRAAVFALVLSMFAVSIAGGQNWVTTYEENFSSDPFLNGWITNNSARYYWEPDSQALFTDNYTNSGDWATTDVTYDGESFRLTFDILPVRDPGETGDVNVGLFGPTRISNSSSTEERLYVLFGGYLNQVYITGYNSGEEWIYSGEGSGLMLNGAWHHVEITYDSETRLLSLEVTRNDSPVVSWQTTMNYGFSSNLLYLGVSLNGSWVQSDRHEIAYIDNMTFALEGFPSINAWIDENGHLWVENHFYRWDVTHGSSLILKMGEEWRDWRIPGYESYRLDLGRGGNSAGGGIWMSDFDVEDISNNGETIVARLAGVFNMDLQPITLWLTFYANSGLVKMDLSIENVTDEPNPPGMLYRMSFVSGGDVSGNDFYHYSGQASEDNFPYNSWMRIFGSSFQTVGSTDYIYITDYDKNVGQGFAMICGLEQTADFITDINYGIAQILDYHPYGGYATMSLHPNTVVSPTVYWYFYETDPETSYLPVEDLINALAFGSICASVNIAGDPASPAQGITVTALDGNNDPVYDPLQTDENGEAVFDSILIGEYSVMIVTPLGYSVSPSETQTNVGVISGECTDVDFVLTPTIIANDCRTIGYWKHQFNVYTSGRGNAQESASDLDAYLDLVHQHFEVLGVYIGLENYDFEDAKDVLTVRGGSLMIERAKQQFFGLLLNFTSGRIGNETVVSDDDRVAAEAVTLVANLTKDGDTANDELAKDICDLINNGQMVGGGIIPESPIRYKFEPASLSWTFSMGQNFPNPFNAQTTIDYVLPVASDVRITFYNLLGQKVVILFKGAQQAGEHTITWDATDFPSGVYFYRIEAGEFAETRKMLLLK